MLLNKEQLVQWQAAAREAAVLDETIDRAEKLADFRELRALDLARAMRFWLWFGPLLALAIWAALNGILAAVMAMQVR